MVYLESSIIFHLSTYINDSTESPLYNMYLFTPLIYSELNKSDILFRFDVLYVLLHHQHLLLFKHMNKNMQNNYKCFLLKFLFDMHNQLHLNQDIEYLLLLHIVSNHLH